MSYHLITSHLFNPVRDCGPACVSIWVELIARGPAGGSRSDEGFIGSCMPIALNVTFPSPVSGAPGVIGFSGRAR